MGRLTCIKDPSGNISRKIKYDLDGNAVEETDALGNTTYSSYDLLGNLIQKQEPVEKRDGAVLYRVTRYEYDRNSNRTAEHQGIDQVALGEEPDHWGHLHYTYDKLNRLIKVEDGSGARTEYQYDCLNQKTCESFQINEDTRKVIRYCYDRAGRLTEKKEELENRFLQPGKKAGTVWSITRYQYDKNGNCTQVITPKGYQKETVYDKIDRMVGLTETDQKSGIKRRFSYTYDRADNLTGRRDDSLEQPRIRSYRYNRRDNLTHYVDEEGGTARIFYDGNGRAKKLVRPEQYDGELDDGPGTCYQYNHMGKVTAVINAMGQTERENEYDSKGNLISSTDGGKSRVEYICNLQGKLLEVHTGSDHLRKGGPAQAYAYDARGNITGVPDGNGNRTEFLLDEWGRIVEIHTPEGGVERYTYDYAGNITSTTDANGGTITYRYNSQGQVCEITDQEGNSEYFYYDEEGRQETHVDRNGNVERTLYNMDNQLVYQRAEDKKGRNPVVNQYVYYPDGNLKEAIGGGITYHYEYTGKGLLKSKNAQGKCLLEYSYDRNQNVIRLTDLTGKSTAYAYDPMDRLERVGDVESGEALAVYRYTPSGRKESLRLGNGVQTKYRYGEDGSLSSLVTVTPEGEVLLNYDYAYDGNGNCTKKSGERYQNEYAYDTMGRLLEAAYNGRKETYAYDLAGNRLKKENAEGTELYSYNSRNQLFQMEKGGNATYYHYDPQGNMLGEVGRDSKEYTYDALNRQTDVTVNGLGQINRYDGEGLRYETEKSGNTAFYLFDYGNLTAEMSGGTVGRYARGYDVVYSEYSGEGGGYHIQDEAKSALFILGRDHDIKKSYRYDAFGRILEESGEIQNIITYTGQMYDGATEQYYLRARFYNPTIGRFIQEDVYRRDGLNLYAYCANNPVMYYDPSGYMGLCPVPKLSKSADSISEKAQNDNLKRGKNYHGRLDLGLEQEILSYPDAVYFTNNKQNLTY